MISANSRPFCLDKVALGSYGINFRFVNRTQITELKLLFVIIKYFQCVFVKFNQLIDNNHRIAYRIPAADIF